MTLPLFKDPPQKLRMPAEPIVRSADIDRFGRETYRWLMRRAWGSGPAIMWILLNPSRANNQLDDPTTLRMMGFSYRWGFGSMIVGNVYPLVSADPALITRWRRTFDHRAYEAQGMREWGLDNTSWSAFHHNQAVISKVLAPDMPIVAAWGNAVDSVDLDHFMHGIRFHVPADGDFGDPAIDIQPEWKCLGINANGTPIHPLARGRNRVPDDANLIPWRVPK